MAHRKSLTCDTGLTLTGTQIYGRTSCHQHNLSAIIKRTNSAANQNDSKVCQNDAVLLSKLRKSGICAGSKTMPISHRSSASAPSFISSWLPIPNSNACADNLKSAGKSNMWSGTTNPTCAKKSLFNLLESEEKPLELLRPEDVDTLDDYGLTQNAAATKIQQWFRRHKLRQQACRAAMSRLLQQKRDDVMKHSPVKDFSPIDNNIQNSMEEKCRRSKLGAFKVLQKDCKKTKYLNENLNVGMKFLQSNGNVANVPFEVGNINRKGRLPTTSNNYTSNRQSYLPSHSINDIETAITDLAGKQLSRDDQNQVCDIDSKKRPSTLDTSHSTLNDLYDSLQKLEEEDNVVFTSRSNYTNSAWSDDFDKVEENTAILTAQNLKKIYPTKQSAMTSNLEDDKLKTIMSFLDEVQVSERLCQIDSDIDCLNEQMNKPAAFLALGEDISQLENAEATASEVTSHVLSQRLQLDEKAKTISLLQKAFNQQRELTFRTARESDKEMNQRLDLQRNDYEVAIKRHLSFIDQLIDDKKVLSEKCEQLVSELKTIDHKYQTKLKCLEDSREVELKKRKDMYEAASKLKMEQWVNQKTQKIKDMTVKGLEPEIQKLIAKHKTEVKKIKQEQQALLLQSDERAAQRYVKLTEDLRDQLAKEKEMAVMRERTLSKERYEKQLQQEEDSFQQQRRRLFQEVEDEKGRIADNASRQRAEIDALRLQLEDSSRRAMLAVTEQLESAREEQERRHHIEVRDMQQRLAVEGEVWRENHRKKHDTLFAQRERELKEQTRRDRDSEIESVISRLEEDFCISREENEKTTETKIRRLRERFEVETTELESSERRAVKKYNGIKAKAAEIEGENERQKVIIRQKEQEINDTIKLLEKMKEERGHVSDIIRQDFADRLVTTEDENRRVKNEISQLRAQHRIDIDRSRHEVEDVRLAKEAELSEVHDRVKKAIIKKEENVTQLKEEVLRARKRADHLEGLLEQQRKQLLKK